MHRIRTHRLGVAQGDLVLFSDFKHDGAMWTGEGPRETRQAVTFDEPFSATPMVHVGLTMWDVDKGANSRMDLTAEAVTPKGFEIVFRTWGDTRIARVRAGWIAMGEVAHEDDWDIA